jgi:hypothetical protein
MKLGESVNLKLAKIKDERTVSYRCESYRAIIRPTHRPSCDLSAVVQEF